MSSQTPLMNQYLSVKREYPDAILLFRLGDFYEMFYDDAKVASEILGNSSYFKGPFEEKSRCPCAAFPSTALSPTYQSFSEAERRWPSANRWATRSREKGSWRERSSGFSPRGRSGFGEPRVKKQQFPRLRRGRRKRLRTFFLRYLDRGVPDLFFPLRRRIFSRSLRMSTRREILVPDSRLRPSLA